MAKLMWACPQCGSDGKPKESEGTCGPCLIPLQPLPEQTTPVCRLALDTPWQRIDLPDGVDVVVGRHTMARPDAARFDHVGRRHLLITAAPATDTATIVDLQSTNGSFVDDVALEPLREHPLRVGGTVRLGRDEGADRAALCTLVRLTDGADA
jgi:hypothetical protein